MYEPPIFELPATVTPSHLPLGQRLAESWRIHGAFQVRVEPVPAQRIVTAMTAGRRFFSMPAAYKARHVGDLSYSGYTAPGEEHTGGGPGHAEIFNVCPDVPYGDGRVRQGLPCHGPVPWPDLEYRLAMRAYMDQAGEIGDRVLRLVALGLGQPADAFTRLTANGWHHLRVLRLPPRTPENRCGIGAHTGHGLLTIVAREGAGGLRVRPPVPGEKRPRNWREGESTAGAYEHEEPWSRVPVRPAALPVLPGDLMQFLTGGLVTATPHKILLGDRDGHALAYCHGPAFETSAGPIGSGDETLHYGTHFTNMLMRRHPDRAVTRRIQSDGGLELLARLRAGALPR
ncbi:2-oxoglutarate and iron-dependent oxygenase domain-containing protein [Spirillospora sp. NPDC029432]|uniref:2-oxoglutarate and iron-dependent oxygenase domain-containing protein n=1 Tax=Spirillospora sp. NPDC029432 TaxID=3154599 RepID=UPI003453EA51